MYVTTLGLDVAKQVFQVPGVEAHGQVIVRKQLRRKEVVGYFTKLPACEIGMEAGSSSHDWARRLIGLGHRVKLMAPQFVRPYVQTNKNDARDVEAICEAVSRPLYDRRHRNYACHS
jgi:transposase